jgi:hypothetical protein
MVLVGGGDGAVVKIGLGEMLERVKQRHLGRDNERGREEQSPNPAQLQPHQITSSTRRR